jgi:hypothetical protein
MWFANNGYGSVGRVTMGGVVTSYTGPSIGHPSGVTTGSDGQIWFTDENDSIQRMATSATTPTAISLASSQNPALAGDPIAYTATVNPTPDGGTVSFTDGSATIAGCASQPVNTSTGQATCTARYATIGHHNITANYSGDMNFSRSGPSPAVLEQIDPLATATITSRAVIATGNSITGTASDAGGPGLARILLNYQNQATGAGGAVLTSCASCGPGHTTTTWSYTPQSGGPLSPGNYTIVAQSVDTADTFGTPSSGQNLTVVPPPTATITSGSPVLPAQSVAGTASDVGGPGLANIILHYKNQNTGATGSVLTKCVGCASGHTSATWSYTPSPGGPLLPGNYIIFAQAVDTATNLGPPSSSRAVTVL